MNMFVVDTNGETYDFPDAEKFVTDEHNNLEVHGPHAVVFNKTCWQRVEVDVED